MDIQEAIKEMESLSPSETAIETILSELDKKDREIQNIREEFLKYDWNNSNKEQICNQLKCLYESIFKKAEGK